MIWFRIKYKLLSAIISALVLLSVNLISVVNASVCVCPPLPICKTYSHSKAVFVGKVVKVVKSLENNIPYLDITFAVKKAYKGKLEKTETARFLDATCQTQFKEGEKYFVYEFKPAGICNPSAPLSQAKFDREYAESLSESEPVFNILVTFDSLIYLGGRTDYARNMQVSIANGEKNIRPLRAKTVLSSSRRKKKARIK